MEHAGFDIARRLANMCSLFRSFLDHFEGYFVRVHGKQSRHYQDWKRSLSKEYDSLLSYRIVYEMRNYIQYQDMPPLSLSIKERAGEEGFSIRVDLKIKRMLDNQRFRKKISASLDQEPVDTSLLELLNEWDQSFQNIINFANEVRIKETHQHAQEIANLRGSLKVGSLGKIALVWFPHVETKPEKLNFSLEWLPEITARLIVEEANSR